MRHRILINEAGARRLNCAIGPATAEVHRKHRVAYATQIRRGHQVIDVGRVGLSGQHGQIPGWTFLGER